MWKVMTIGGALALAGCADGGMTEQQRTAAASALFAYGAGMNAQSQLYAEAAAQTRAGMGTDTTCRAYGDTLRCSTR